MNIIKEVKEYGLLAEFVYLKLEHKNFKDDFKDSQNSEIVKNYIQGLNAEGKIAYTPPKSTSPITDEELKDMTDIKPERREAMLSVLDKYDIKEFSSDDGFFSSDFQGMLLQNKETGQFVIAFRGTAGEKDVLIDAGIAGNHNFQYNEALKFTKDCMEKYDIKEENLKLTGHSLGGILVQMVGSELKIPGYAFNPLGSQNLVHPLFPKAYRLLEQIGLYSSNESKFANENIVNISYQDTGLLKGDILSNLATNVINSKHMGQVINIFGNNLGLDAHSIIPTNNLLDKLDKKHISSIENIIEYNNKFLELEKINSHEQKLKDWQSMTPEQKATAIQNGYGLGLSYNTQGIKNLEEVSKEVVAKFESNKEIKNDNISLAFNDIKEQKTAESKIEVLESLDLESHFDNIYAKQFISQYKDKVIGNRGEELSNLDFLNINIQQNSLSSNNDLQNNSQNNNNNSKEESNYIAFSSLAKSEQNNNSSVQTVG